MAEERENPTLDADDEDRFLILKYPKEISLGSLFPDAGNTGPNDLKPLQGHIDNAIANRDESILNGCVLCGAANPEPMLFEPSFNIGRMCHEKFNGEGNLTQVAIGICKSCLALKDVGTRVKRKVLPTALLIDIN